MKKIWCVLLCLLLLAATVPMAVSAAGSLKGSASAGSVTVGSSVTVTFTYSGGGKTVGAIGANLKYDAATFQYVSCSGTNGVSGNGGSGIVRLMFYVPTATAPSSVSFKLVFKAIGTGTGAFEMTTEEFVDYVDYVSLGAPTSKVSVVSTNPTLSANADLKSLKPSAGTLKPAFSAKVTEYTIAVPYTTLSLSLSATAAQSGAKVAVTGGNDLAVGQNTQIVTVTAPSGKTKKYTVVITRSADQNTDVSQPQTEPTGSDQPDTDPMNITVNGKTYRLSTEQPKIDLPTGFDWEYAAVNGVSAPVAVNSTTGVQLVYLLDGDKGAFFIYTAPDGFVTLTSLEVAAGMYALWDMPADATPPENTVPGVYTFGESTVTVYRYTAENMTDYVIVYATAPNGNTGLYTYDAQDGTMQRYRELVLAEQSANGEQGGTFLTRAERFVLNHQKLLWICLATFGGLILLVMLIVLLARGSRQNDNPLH